jgi:hypothetical protein
MLCADVGVLAGLARQLQHLNVEGTDVHGSVAALRVVGGRVSGALHPVCGPS